MLAITLLPLLQYLGKVETDMIDALKKFRFLLHDQDGFREIERSLPFPEMKLWGIYMVCKCLEQ